MVLATKVKMKYTGIVCSSLIHYINKHEELFNSDDYSEKLEFFQNLRRKLDSSGMFTSDLLKELDISKLIKKIYKIIYGGGIITKSYLDLLVKYKDKPSDKLKIKISKKEKSMKIKITKLLFDYYSQNYTNSAFYKSTFNSLNKELDVKDSSFLTFFRKIGVAFCVISMLVLGGNSYVLANTGGYVSRTASVILNSKGDKTFSISDSNFNILFEQDKLSDLGNKNINRFDSSQENVKNFIQLDDAVYDEICSKLNLNNLNSEMKARTILKFVQQNIKYVKDSVLGDEDYVQFPYETLARGEGDCEDMSILTATLMKKAGLNVVLFYFSDHVAVGVQGDFKGLFLTLDSQKFFFAETTNVGWEIGEIPPKYRKRMEIIKL